MNLDEWYLEYERLMQQHTLEMRKLSRQLAHLTNEPLTPDSPDDVVASTNTPDIEGQERLHLTPRPNEVP